MKLESQKILGVLKFLLGEKRVHSYSQQEELSVRPRDFLDATYAPSKFTAMLWNPPEALPQLPGVLQGMFLIKSLVS